MGILAPKMGHQIRGPNVQLLICNQDICRKEPAKFVGNAIEKALHELENDGDAQDMKVNSAIIFSSDLQVLSTKFVKVEEKEHVSQSAENSAVGRDTKPKSSEDNSHEDAPVVQRLKDKKELFSKLPKTYYSFQTSSKEFLAVIFFLYINQSTETSLSDNK